MNKTTSKVVKKKTSAFAGLVMGAVAMAFAHQASASLVMTIDDLSTPGIDVIIVDDVDGGVGTATAKGASNAADSSAGDGFITFNGAVGAFSVNVTTGISKPIIGSASVARIDLNSVNVSGAAGDLEIMLTDTDFTLAGTQAILSNEIGGTTDGTVTTTHSLDAANVEFGSSAQLGPQQFGPGAFAYTTSTGALLAGPFSLSNNVLIQHTDAGQITSFDSLTQAVPVPGTILLMGLGLLGLSFAGRRK